MIIKKKFHLTEWQWKHTKKLLNAATPVLRGLFVALYVYNEKTKKV